VSRWHTVEHERLQLPGCSASCTVAEQAGRKLGRELVRVEPVRFRPSVEITKIQTDGFFVLSACEVSRLARAAVACGTKVRPICGGQEKQKGE
jgi:hypothetical protein